MLDWNFGKLFKYLPCGRCVDVIVENDFIDFTEQGFLVQVVERCVELVGVGVFAIDHNIYLFAVIQEPVNAGFCLVSCVGYLAKVSKIIFVRLV